MSTCFPLLESVSKKRDTRREQGVWGGCTCGDGQLGTVYSAGTSCKYQPAANCQPVISSAASHPALQTLPSHSQKQVWTFISAKFFIFSSYSHNILSLQSGSPDVPCLLKHLFLVSPSAQLVLVRQSHLLAARLPCSCVVLALDSLFLLSYLVLELSPLPVPACL